MQSPEVRFDGDALKRNMMTTDLPSGTVTFLFTDIEGSTPLWERKPERMRAALARHNAILRQAVAAHNGALYKMIGDGIQAAFALPADALAAALAEPDLIIRRSTETPGYSVKDALTHETA